MPITSIDIKKYTRKKIMKHCQISKIITLHLSMLTNSTCFPPDGVILVNLGIPISSSTSANLAPPQIAERTSTNP